MSSGTASKELMERLHGALAKEFETMLTEGITVTDKEGNAIKTSAPAATLNVIRQFLKDNGVEALAAPGTPLGNVAANLPFPDKGEDTYTAH
jgi:hypothetical protein